MATLSMPRIWAWGSRWPIACARWWSRSTGRPGRGQRPGSWRPAYYLGLLMNVYCHADAAEQARWIGDDISFKGDGVRLLGPCATAQMISFILRRVGSHGSSRGAAPNG